MNPELLNGEAGRLFAPVILLGVINDNQNQNVAASLNEAHACTHQSLEPDKCHLPGIEGHMHRLLACEKEVVFWARTDHNVSVYKNLLDRWKSADCPNPETWPDLDGSLILEAWNSCDHGVYATVTPNSINMRNPVSPERVKGLTASKLSELLRISWNELVLSVFALVKAG